MQSQQQRVMSEVDAWLKFPANFFNSFQIKESPTSQWHLINWLVCQTKREFTPKYLNRLLPPLMGLKNANYHIPSLLRELRDARTPAVIRFADPTCPRPAQAQGDFGSATPIELTKHFDHAVNEYVINFLSETCARRPNATLVPNYRTIMRDVFDFHRNQYVWRWQQFVSALSRQACEDNPPLFEAELAGGHGLEYWLIIHTLWCHRYNSELQGMNPELRLKEIERACGRTRHIDRDRLHKCLQYLGTHDVVYVEGQHQPRYVISDLSKSIFLDYIDPLPGIRDRFRSSMLRKAS